MAVGITPLSPKSQQGLNMVLPMPPPLLHTRSGNEIYDRTQTPTTPGGTSNHGFTSPVRTPQGSPSKNQFPPGANDLPNVFDNAMKLAPMSPTKAQGTSPTKERQDPFADPAQQSYGRSESPTRQSNKENAPANGYGKASQQGYAANAREQQYRTADKKTVATTKGLTTEEMQKLQAPKVKRLANVTQLCKCSYAPQRKAQRLTDRRLPRLLLRPALLRPQPSSQRSCLQRVLHRLTRPTQGRVRYRTTQVPRS